MSIALVQDLILRHQSRGRNLLFSLLEIDDVEERAEGSFVYGESGRRFLEFGGYAVFLLGHRHPAIVAAVKNQLELLAGSTRLLPSRVNAEAAAAIAAIAPAGMSKVMLLNSGTEANEAALKLARIATGRTGLVGLERAFHGKTFGSLSLTPKGLLQDAFRPLIPGAISVPRDDADVAVQTIERLRPAAFIFEAIQGEGGIYEIEHDYLKLVRDACTRTGTLMIADEVQCGMGRCGRMWGFEHAGVVPDLMTLGKALGGGVFPVSALVSNAASFTAFDRDPLLHTSTFGGNPLASAAVKATIETVTSEDIPARCESSGPVLKSLLNAFVRNQPQYFTSVSGRGLMLGLHCTEPQIAALFTKFCLKRGVLLTPCIGDNVVVRISPSAFVTNAEIEFFASVVSDVIQDINRDFEIR